MLFQPVAIESFGPADEDTMSFLTKLTASICERTGDPRDGQRCFQQLSCLLNKFNAFCIIENLKINADNNHSKLCASNRMLD